MPQQIPTVAIAGAGGRLGPLLRALWPEGEVRALWSARRPVAGLLRWEVGAAPPPAAFAGVDALILLAGVTAGPEEALARNAELALAGLAAARAAGIRHVFCLSSASVYGRDAWPGREDAAPGPASPYGAAKAAMEARLAGERDVTCLRLGNVVGADALGAALVAAWEEGAPLLLDRWPDGAGPRRAAIGPGRLAAVLAALVRRAAEGAALPPLLNLAEPGSVPMAALAAAAGVAPRWRPAPEAALQATALDLRRLAGVLGAPLPPADPVRMIAEWRAARTAAA